MAEKSDIPLSERSARFSASSEVTESRRPPARRDPRADPDDEPLGERVDVIGVDRGERGVSPDTLTNAALTLRRELAKLHQQAAAVERTIEDQRRERSDAVERLEAASLHTLELEERLEAADAEIISSRRLHEAALAELQIVRGERDDLLRAVDAAQASSAEASRAKAEIETLREAQEEALRTAATYEAELGEIRKREQAGAALGEAELGQTRERLERASAELGQIREEAAQAKTEVARLREEAAAAGEALGRAREEAERERSSSKEQTERLERALADARAAEEKLATAATEQAALRVAAAESHSEISGLQRDVEAARHSRDVNLERATMAEQELETSRLDVERLQRELETTTSNVQRLETRARTAERTRGVVEESVRDLRDEVAAAFARWRAALPSSFPAEISPLGSSAPAPPIGTNESLAPPTRRGSTTSFPPIDSEATPAPGLEVETGWSSSPPPPRKSTMPPAASPSSRSVPPPPAVAPPSITATSLDAIPPTVYPSVPPLTPVSLNPPDAVPSDMPPESVPPSSASIRNRDQLIEMLVDPSLAREAAEQLRARSDWLTGRPPLELLEALTTLDYDVEDPVFELARSWERDILSRALVAAMRDEPDAKLREHGAWLLKHLGSPVVLPAILELVTDEAEPSPVRRWLLEAIERLVALKAVGWTDIQALVASFVKNSDPVLRDGAIGIVAASDRTDDKRRLLLDLLRTDDDEMVLASAVHALSGVLPVSLDPSVTERLLNHPSARVQRSVVDFIERSRRRT